MKTSRAFLSGLGIATIGGLVLTAWKRKGSTSVSNRVTANQTTNDPEERCNEAENGFTSAAVDFSRRLSLLQELHERSAASLDEGQRSVAAELRRLRILVTWALILSCFGVVSFAIVLFLAYIKY